MAFFHRSCTERGCDRAHHAKGLCHAHYQLFKKHGNTVGIQHKKSSTPEYRVWRSLRQRCLNPNETNFANYGGRGITVCESWDKFENFLEDMGTRPTPRHSIDRIDNNKGYSPENCRWATTTEQNYNKRYRKGYRGVYLSGKSWIASISEAGKDTYIGSFKTAEQAATAWNEYALRLRGKNATLNVLGVGYGVL